LFQYTISTGPKRITAAAGNFWFIYSYIIPRRTAAAIFEIDIFSVSSIVFSAVPEGNNIWIIFGNNR